MTQWMRTRSVRMLGALFGLSLMLSACDIGNVLQLIGERPPVETNQKNADPASTGDAGKKPAAEKAGKKPAAEKAGKKPAAEKAGKKAATKAGAPAAEKTTKPAAKPASKQSKGGGVAGALTKVEAEIFETLNATRQKQGHKPLALSSDIAKGSRDYSCQMAKSGQFKHANLRAAGVNGENIAAGQPSAASVHTAWMNSPGHRSNRMNDRWSEYGVGVCKNSSGTPYYTERFR